MPNKSAIRKHPDAQAWDDFITANPDLLDLSTVGTRSGDPTYLRNRLNRAFIAGIDYARGLTKQGGERL